VTSKVFDSKEWVVLAHQRLGEARLSQGRLRRTEGIAELRTSIELDPKRVEPYLSLGQALYNEGNFIEAASQYQAAIKIDPQSAAAHNGLARALAKRGLVEQAASDNNNAAKANATTGNYSAKLRPATAPTAPN
jgi:cytochrome c-type biogenesis protein CcmH/NrfG